MTAAAGLTCRQDPQDPASWAYVPEHVSPELGLDGTPAVLLLPGDGEGGVLQLGTRLDPQPAALEALRARIEDEHPDLGRVRLVPGVLSVAAARLSAGDGDAEPAVVAEAATSGFPPWTAVFRVPLDASGAAAAQAALDGERGRLLVTYDVALAGGGRAAPGADVGAWFDPTTQRDTDAEDQ